MEKVRHQQLRIVLACIAVLVTVFSFAMTFTPFTAHAAEVITDTSFKSDYYSILISPGNENESLSPCNWINFSFTLKQSSNHVDLQYLDFNLWDTLIHSPFGVRPTGSKTVYNYFEAGGYNVSADAWESHYYPYKVVYPENFTVLMNDSKYVVPSMVTFSIDQPDSNSSYYYMNGNTRVDILPENIYSELRISIALRDNDRSLITISFPEYFSSDDILANWTGLPVGNAGEIIAQYHLGDSVNYDEGYNNGFLDGFTDANNTLVTDSKSYREGYSSGRTAGYSTGYNDGTQAAGNYTFFSLISSVIDVPIQAIKGLLDFNLFGVDMSSLYLSLFTLCIVIMVIKLLL